MEVNLVTKKQILRGIINYLETEVLPGIGEDRGLQVLASTVLTLIKNDLSVLNGVLARPFLKVFIKEDESGNIDIEPLFKAIKESLDKCKFFPITIPVIPFVTSEEKQLKFNCEDIAKLEKMISEG